MNKFLIVDTYSSTNDYIVNTMDEVLEYFKDEEVDQRGYKSDHPVVYEIVREVKVNYRPAFFVAENEGTSIPAPLPGETVSDYARRITGG